MQTGILFARIWVFDPSVCGSLSSAVWSFWCDSCWRCCCDAILCMGKIWCLYDREFRVQMVEEEGDVPELVHLVHEVTPVDIEVVNFVDQLTHYVSFCG